MKTNANSRIRLEAAFSDYVALSVKLHVSQLAYHSQRHIMFNATEEIKLDGYRAIAVKSARTVNLYSRRKKSFNSQYPYIVEALRSLPEETVVDRMGQIVCEWVDAYRGLFLFAFIFSIVVSLTYGWTALAPWFSRQWSMWRTRHHGRKHLRNLSTDEKAICRWFVDNNGASLHHNEANGALGSLKEAGIVFTRGEPWGNGMRDFRMHPWHLEFLKKRPKLLA